MPISESTQATIDDLIGKQKERDALNLIGGETGSDALALRNEAAEESTLDLVGRGFNSVNAAFGIKDWAERKLLKPDPDFNLEDHWGELQQGLPVEYHGKFRNVRSLEEARMLKSDLQTELQNLKILGAAGARGFVAMGLSGIIDVDAPLMLMSGGTYSGTKVASLLASAGLRSGRVANAIRTGVAGAEAGIVTETANVLARPTGQWTDIGYAGLGGLAFGTGLGSLSKGEIAANKAMSKTREDFDDSIQSGAAGYRDYFNPVTTQDRVFDFDAQRSVGAATRGEDPFDAENATPGLRSARSEAQKFLLENDLINESEFAFPNTATGIAARKFYDFLQKTPLATDFDRLWNSDSAIAKVLAYKLFESPAGIVRNNKSAAILNEVYMTQIAHPVNTQYIGIFDEWLAENMPRVGNMVDPNSPSWMPEFMHRFNRDLRETFDKEVVEELQYRYHDGVSNPTSSPAVIRMADAIDEASSRAVKIMQGMDAETAVKGAENLKPEKGWFRQVWRGDKINKAIERLAEKTGSKAKAKQVIVKGLAEAYLKTQPHWDLETATKFAKAVVRRAAAKERGIDTNLYRMLDQEGSQFMEEFLVDNGFSSTSTKELIDGLRNVNADKQKINTLKHRKDVDLRETIPGTDIRVIDLVDTDIPAVWTKYSRMVSGASAMARNGIQKSDLREIGNLIRQEIDSVGGKQLPDDFMDSVASYFAGGPYAGGLNPWVRRALQTTNLSLLNSLGLTQVAESGVMVAAVGWEGFKKTAPKEVRDMLDGKVSPAMDELRGLTAVVDGEHLLYRDYLALDEMRADPGHFAELGQFLDRQLVRGSALQGYLSGFYKVKQLQQRIAVRSMLYRFGEAFRDGRALSDARMQDMGFNAKNAARISEYFKNGTVEFADDGDVIKLNLDKWNPEDVEDFAGILNRHAYQVVQRALRGESSEWMHKDFGAVLSHLKTFTILTMQKQLVRNMKIMDPEAAMAFIYSMATAGVVYTTGQVLKGNSDRLDAASVMKGAFVLSNMTGFIPQWSDPLMSMLGMDNLRFYHYGAQGVGGDVVGVPPVLTTVNRMAHIPEAALGLATGTYKNEDIYALQSTPIIGNLYGFSYMFNQMKK